MLRRVFGVALAGVMALTVAPVIGSNAVDPGNQVVKLDPVLVQQIQAQGTATALVRMAAGDADVSAAYDMVDRDARGQYVYDTLKAHADATQADLARWLSGRGLKYTGYWIANMVIVEGASLDDVQAMAARPDVAEVYHDKVYTIDFRRVSDSATGLSPKASAAPESVGWNIAKVNADDVWNTYGIRGAGIVVANVDTGVRYTHNALRTKYRGFNGGHDYNWWDPDHTLLVPTDNNDHGTHTMGTMVGDDGGANQIGMAPDAQWIAAQGCDSNSCANSDLLSSGQWIACPTRVDGTQPDCSKRPHVVNNSWGGGGGDAWYASTVLNWLASGIMPVFSAGNSGSNCNTMGSPGDYKTVIGVGATTQADVLASFSSKGPGRFGFVKPNIVAPGDNVRSSTRGSDSSYANFSGTSMAAPHVAGLVALMESANPQLRYNPIGVLGPIMQTATHGLGAPPGPDSCGGRNYNQWPNYIYGYGQIDAFAAVTRIRP